MTDLRKISFKKFDHKRRDKSDEWLALTNPLTQQDDPYHYDAHAFYERTSRDEESEEPLITNRFFQQNNNLVECALILGLDRLEGYSDFLKLGIRTIQQIPGRMREMTLSRYNQTYQKLAYALDENANNYLKESPTRLEQLLSEGHVPAEDLGEIQSLLTRLRRIQPGYSKPSDLQQEGSLGNKKVYFKLVRLDKELLTTLEEAHPSLKLGLLRLVRFPQLALLGLDEALTVNYDLRTECKKIDYGEMLQDCLNYLKEIPEVSTRPLLDAIYAGLNKAPLDIRVTSSDLYRVSRFFETAFYKKQKSAEQIFNVVKWTRKFSEPEKKSLYCEALSAIISGGVEGKDLYDMASMFYQIIEDRDSDVSRGREHLERVKEILATDNKYFHATDNYLQSVIRD